MKKLRGKNKLSSKLIFVFLPRVLFLLAPSKSIEKTAKTEQHRHQQQQQQQQQIDIGNSTNNTPLM